LADSESSGPVEAFKQPFASFAGIRDRDLDRFNQRCDRTMVGFVQSSAPRDSTITNMDMQCFFGEFKAADKKQAAAKEAGKDGKDPAAKEAAKPNGQKPAASAQEKTFTLDTAYAQKEKDDQELAKAKTQDDSEEMPKGEKEAEAKDD